MSNLKPKGLTISTIFDAMSLNYGEGIGNISELKKLSRSGELYSYESRQAIRYDIYRMLKEVFNIDDKEDPLTAQNEVVQFKSDANIKDYIEADFFGYMKTEKSNNSITRAASVRISPAVALEPMNLDVEFGTNLNFAQRAGANPNPFQFEHQSSLYSYTITIELDKIGKDENDDIDLEPKEKANRVNMLLDVLKILNRNIKGRMESLNPLFAIGGVYGIKNPFFLGRLKIDYNQESRKYSINTSLISSILDMCFGEEKVKNNTYIGFVDGYWNNEEEIKNLLEQRAYNVNDFFEKLKEEVSGYYGV